MFLSISLRLDELIEINQKFILIYLINIIFFLVLARLLKFYRVLFRYFTILELKKYFIFVFIHSLLFLTLVIFIQPVGFPRSVPIINIFIFSFLLILSRFFISSSLRKIKVNHDGIKTKNIKSVIIYGSGNTGNLIIDNFKYDKSIDHIFFVDDDLAKHNRYLNGIKIHPFSHTTYLIEKYNVDTMIITITNLSKIKQQKIFDLINKKNINLLSVPNIIENSNFNSLENLIDLKNEFLVTSKIKNSITAQINSIFIKKSILVTGGGGSIGSELCKQISTFDYDKLIIADISEYNLFKVKEELSELYDLNTNPKKNIEFILIDLKDSKSINELFEKYHPDIVYHAAAYKHVPIVEDNAKISIKNNFLGTVNLVNNAIKFKVKRFLFISTDKAVNPINLMGATKRLGELYIKKKCKQSSCNFSIVRFGNVIGSSGSAIPLFINQIKNGGPVTITHPEATRYFMTIPDAVSLIINASIIAKGEEIFVLNMGEPKKIIDVANKLIQKSLVLSNNKFKPSDIKIQIIGLRKNEKIHEEIYIETQSSQTENPNILISYDTNKEENDIIGLYNYFYSNINNLSSEQILDSVNNFFNNEQ